MVLAPLTVFGEIHDAAHLDLVVRREAVAGEVDEAGVLPLALD